MGGQRSGETRRKNAPTSSIIEQAQPEAHLESKQALRPPLSQLFGSSAEAHSESSRNRAEGRHLSVEPLRGRHPSCEIRPRAARQKLTQKRSRVLRRRRPHRSRVLRTRTRSTKQRRSTVLRQHEAKAKHPELNSRPVPSRPNLLPPSPPQAGDSGIDRDESGATRRALTGAARAS
jgi:hypothetical protein